MNPTAKIPRALFALSFAFVTVGTVADVAVPPLHARVTDLTHTLSASQTAALEQELGQLEARKGAQLAVLIVPTTEPETIEQYGIRVAEAWKLGRKGVDDGAILLVAKNDRKLRIEVGYGLEGVIPDAVAKRVISEVIVPFFKQGDYYGGIHAGVTRLIRLVDGEPLPPPSARDVGWTGWRQALPFAFIGVFVLAGIMRAIFGRLLGASAAAAITVVVIWLVFGSIAIAIVLGLLVFLFALIAGLQSHGGYGGWSSSGGYGGGGFGGGGGFQWGRWWFRRRWCIGELVKLNLRRLWRHLSMPRWQIRRAFPARTLHAIEAAIGAAEATHDGQICFAVEGALEVLPLLQGRSARERALEVFAQRRIWDTEKNNGVLIYLLLADRDVEILADRGVHPRVGAAEWERICQTMEKSFRSGQFENGVIDGIHAVSRHLARHYPRSGEGTNEVPDRPVIL